MRFSVAGFTSKNGNRNFHFSKLNRMKLARFLFVIFICSETLASTNLLDLNRSTNIIGNSINGIWQTNDSAIIATSNSLLTVNLTTWDVLNYKKLLNPYGTVGFVYDNALYVRSNAKDSQHILRSFNISTLDNIEDTDVGLYGSIAAAFNNGQYGYLLTSNSSAQGLLKIDLKSSKGVKILAFTLLPENATTIATYSSFLYITFPGYIGQYFLFNLSFVSQIPFSSDSAQSATQGANIRFAFYTFENSIMKMDLKNYTKWSSAVSCVANSFILVNTSAGFCVDTENYLCTIGLSNMALRSRVPLESYGRNYVHGITSNGLLYYGSTDNKANIVQADFNMKVDIQLGLLYADYNPWVSTYGGDDYIYFGSFSTPPTIVKVAVSSYEIVATMEISNEFGFNSITSYSPYIFVTTINPYSDQWVSAAILKIRTTTMKLEDKLVFDGCTKFVSSSFYFYKGYFVCSSANGTNYMEVIDLDLFQRIGTYSIAAQNITFGTIYESYIYLADSTTIHRYNVLSQMVDATLGLSGTTICIGNGLYLYCNALNLVYQIDITSFTPIANVTFLKGGPAHTAVIMGNYMYFADNSSQLQQIPLNLFITPHTLPLPGVAVSAISDGVNTLIMGTANGKVYKMDYFATTSTTGIPTTSTTGMLTTGNPASSPNQSNSNSESSKSFRK